MSNLDLFERPELLPEEVNKVINKYSEIESYVDCKKLVEELNILGYTCEYGLDAVPYDLKKL